MRLHRGALAGEPQMRRLILRNLDPDLLAALGARALRHGRTRGEELSRALTDALGVKPAVDFPALTCQMRAMTAAAGFDNSTAFVRAMRDHR